MGDLTSCHYSPQTSERGCRPVITESDSPPPRDGYASDEGVGKLHHQVPDDVWYECVFDSRRREYTWSILPPGDTGSWPAGASARESADTERPFESG